MASLIDLKADLEGPSSLRDLLLDRSKLRIPNTDTKFLPRTQKLRTGPSPFVIANDCQVRIFTSFFPGYNTYDENLLTRFKTS